MKIKNLMMCCLFFTANRFSRIITKMAEESFAKIGLSPTEAFAIMVLNECETIGSSQMAGYLHLAPSTVTRFIDKLVIKGYCSRKHEGKNSNISITDAGKNIMPDLAKCWEGLYNDYSKKIGYELGDKLTTDLYELSDKLEQ